MHFHDLQPIRFVKSGSMSSYYQEIITASSQDYRRAYLPFRPLCVVLVEDVVTRVCMVKQKQQISQELGILQCYVHCYAV